MARKTAEEILAAKRFKARMDRVMTETHVAFPTPDGAMVKGTLCVPKSEIVGKALLLHEIEGFRNGGLNTLQKVAHLYARKGIASLRIDFSGHRTRRDEWQRYSPQSMVVDATTSLNFLDEQIPSIEQTTVIGASTGGSIAVLVGEVDKRVEQTVLLYPVLSYRDTFLAAANGNSFGIPMNAWDAYTPWRRDFFRCEEIEASLEEGKPFDLYVHRYGAKFIKGCQRFIDANTDVDFLFSCPGRNIPTTIIQGDLDPCIPYLATRALTKAALERDKQVRLWTMHGMGHRVDKNWQRAVLRRFEEAVTQPFIPGMKTISLGPWIDRYPPPNVNEQIPPHLRLNK